MTALSLIRPEDRAIPRKRADALTLLRKRTVLNADALRALREIVRKPREQQA